MRRSPKHALKAVVVGSSNTDLVLRLPKLPEPGESVLGGEFETHAGGKGANQAVALARAGLNVTFVGTRGADAFGTRAAAALREEGIDIRHFDKSEKTDMPSGVALILIGGRANENMIGVAAGANNGLTPASVRDAEAEIARSSVVVAQLEVPLPAVLEAARIAGRHGIPFVLNPAPIPQSPIPSSLWKLVHTVVPNESEARELTGKSDPLDAAQSLLARGCKNVVITLGSKGALLLDGGEEHWVRSRRVKPIDTVGAGDCFCAWLAAGISEGLPLPAAAARACLAASIAVTRKGAQPGMPKRSEVIR